MSIADLFYWNLQNQCYTFVKDIEMKVVRSSVWVRVKLINQHNLFLIVERNLFDYEYPQPLYRNIKKKA